MIFLVYQEMSSIELFSKHDPYVLNGLVTAYKLKCVKKGIGIKYKICSCNNGEYAVIKINETKKLPQLIEKNKRKKT